MMEMDVRFKIIAYMSDKQESEFDMLHVQFLLQ